MKGRKIEVAKKAGIALAFRAIENKDKVGLVVFGEEVKESVYPCGDFHRILDEITKVRPGKETDMVSVIKKSIEMFSRINATKHLILLTDALQTIGSKDEVIDMVVPSKDSTILTVTALGFAKRTTIDEYRLTSRGGKTSHAAVVARGMGKPCVSGCEAIHIDDMNRRATIGDTMLHEGDVITIDGGNGNVYAGEVPTVQAEFNQDMVTLLKWADQVARLKVMANADTPEDAVRAREFGAMGIGLCRTERMFNSTDRLPIVQEMILAESIEERQAALDRLLPIQRTDFKGIFKAMKGLPVTVRLIDPPLHEFLPTAAQLELEIAHLHHLRDSLKALEELPETLKLLNPKLYQQYADGLTKLGRSMTEFRDTHLEEDVIHKKEKTLKKVRALSEVNPMLGHRGVRLGITYPEITAMQAKAIFEAAAELIKDGRKPYPEIMIPVVCDVKELNDQLAIAR